MVQMPWLTTLLPVASASYLLLLGRRTRRTLTIWDDANLQKDLMLVEHVTRFYT